jgi:chromosome partitioning protein
MASPYSSGEREKVASRLPVAFHKQLKIRAAQLEVDIQDAVTTAVQQWCELPSAADTVDTAGAEPFSTWLPPGLYDTFKGICADRQVSYIQGLAQSVQQWLDATSTGEPEEEEEAAQPVQRIVVGNQKGGVGKTAISAGVAQGKAEDVELLRREAGSAGAPPSGWTMPAGVPGAEPLSLDDAQQLALHYAHEGRRVLLVDFDPQGHLTKQLGHKKIPIGQDSLISHMCGEGKAPLRDIVVPLDDPRFGGRLHLLPGSGEGFLLDGRLAIGAMKNRGMWKESALERALAPLEEYYDVILLDCPPSLGLAMDAAIYYAARRPGERKMRSGVLIVVDPDDSSAEAYELLTSQINDMMTDLGLQIDYLGIVVNHYDARRGTVATESLREWLALGDEGDIEVLAVVGDLKEQREAVHVKQPLLSYAPRCMQAHLMRVIAGRCS